MTKSNVPLSPFKPGKGDLKVLTKVVVHPVLNKLISILPSAVQVCMDCFITNGINTGNFATVMYAFLKYLLVYSRFFFSLVKSILTTINAILIVGIVLNQQVRVMQCLLTLPVLWSMIKVIECIDTRR